MENPEVVYIVSKLKELVAKGKLDAGDYMELVAACMETVEKLSNSRGEYKKGLVLSAINAIVSESEDETLKSILTPVTVSNLVEVIIRAAKGKYQLRSRFKYFKTGVKNCCKC